MFNQMGLLTLFPLSPMGIHTRYAVGYKLDRHISMFISNYRWTEIFYGLHIRYTFPSRRMRGKTLPNLCVVFSPFIYPSCFGVSFDIIEKVEIHDTVLILAVE